MNKILEYKNKLHDRRASRWICEMCIRLAIQTEIIMSASSSLEWWIIEEDGLQLNQYEDKERSEEDGGYMSNMNLIVTHLPSCAIIPWSQSDRLFALVHEW